MLNLQNLIRLIFIQTHIIQKVHYSVFLQNHLFENQNDRAL